MGPGAGQAGLSLWGCRASQAQCLPPGPETLGESMSQCRLPRYSGTGRPANQDMVAMEERVFPHSSREHGAQHAVGEGPHREAPGPVDGSTDTSAGAFTVVSVGRNR